MITIYWKFGTRGRAVSVGVTVTVGEGVKVGESVGVDGTGVDVGAPEGTGDGGKVGGAEVAQAVNKTNKKIQVPNRFIKPLSILLYNALSAARSARR
jgi:hypothetical protein